MFSKIKQLSGKNHDEPRPMVPIQVETTSSSNPDTMNYWSRLFPAKTVTTMYSYIRPDIPKYILNYSLRPISYREFRIQNQRGYWFPHCFASDEEMKWYFRRNGTIQRVDVGPVFDNSYSMRQTQSSISRGDSSENYDPDIAPVAKEFVYDFDADDASRFRGCCRAKKTICAECWPLCLTTARIIDSISRNTFGFKDIMWVFSGKRGVHGWVFDSEAMRLNNPERERHVSVFERIYEYQNNLFDVDVLTKGMCGVDAAFLRDERDLFVAHRTTIDTVIRPFVRDAIDNNYPILFKEDGSHGPYAAKRLNDTTYITEGLWTLISACSVPEVACEIDGSSFIADIEWSLSQLSGDSATFAEVWNAVMDPIRSVVTRLYRDGIPEARCTDQKTNKVVNKRQRMRAAAASYDATIAVLDSEKDHQSIRSDLRYVLKSAYDIFDPRSPDVVMDHIMDRFCMLLVGRIDIPVSRDRNHLLKCVFSAHPSTGKISVPFDITTCTWKNPLEEVPSVSTIVTDEGREMFKECVAYADAFMKRVDEHRKQYVLKKVANKIDLADVLVTRCAKPPDLKALFP